MISLICKRYGITNYIINPDGSIDVNGDVDLSFNDLTEFPLRFNRVDGDFRCSNNDLTSLKGSPKWIGGNFRSSFNDLTSLEFSPKWVGGYFSCTYNKLRDLEYSPDYVGGWFGCGMNKLTDNYCETEIGGSFYTTLKQDGLTEDNYNEWRKLYKRKKILDELYTRHL